MAIALDSTSSGDNSAGNPLTVSHTVSGSDRILVVSLLIASSRSVSSATYNGVSLGAARQTTSSFHLYKHLLYALLAPDTGTHDIVITADGSSDPLGLAAASYTGVGSLRSDGFHDSHGGFSDNTPSVVITDGQSGDTAVSGVAGYSVTLTTPNTKDVSSVIAGTLIVGIGSAPVTGSFQFDWTMDTSGQVWGCTGFAMVPAGGAAPKRFVLIPG